MAIGERHSWREAAHLYPVYMLLVNERSSFFEFVTVENHASYAKTRGIKIVHFNSDSFQDETKISKYSYKFSNKH